MQAVAEEELELSMVWKKGSRIPTNLIIGFLGSGKTTAISKLITRRPPAEKWSIFINEYGMVSIDQALLETGTKEIEVQELGGGCACCTMSYAFEPLLAQFIRQTKPDRLILEPSGTSHPAKIVDVMRSANFASSIDLRNTICLIDPKDFENVRKREMAVFHDQIQLADIVIVNWTDKRSRSQIEQCIQWVETFAPPKLLIVESRFGDIDLKWLDWVAPESRQPTYPNAHPTPRRLLDELILKPIGADVDPSKNPDDLLQPSCGHPIRVHNDQLGYDACGWIFHLDDVFEWTPLLELLANLTPISRLKGVFRCKDDWWSLNRVKEVTSYAPTAYRRDSRLEIIVDQPAIDWLNLEQKLLACLATKP